MSDPPVISGANFIISPVVSQVTSLAAAPSVIENPLASPIASNTSFVISPALSVGNFVSPAFNSPNLVVSPGASASNVVLSAACNATQPTVPRPEDCNTVRVNTMPTNQNVPTYTTAINFNPLPVFRMNVPVLNKQPETNLVYVNNNPTDLTQRLVGDTVFLVAGNADGNIVDANLVLQPSAASSVLVRFPTSTEPLQQNNKTNFLLNQEQSIAEPVNKVNECNEEAKQELQDVHLCEFEGCRKKFSSKKDLHLHMSTHREKKSLVCTYENCRREFAWPTHLKYHLLTHTGSRQFKCDVPDCGKSFYTPQRLEVHMRTHNGDKPFACTKCRKAFTTFGNLKNHFRIHSGERPYTCDKEGCYRTFTEMSSLKKHKLVHTGEKPFSCEKCGKMFTQSGSRTAHMKKHKLSKENEEDNPEDLCNNPKLENPNVLVLRQAEENMLTYEEFHDSDQGVFTQTINQNVTVTTQSSEGDSNQINLSNEIFTEEILETDEKECVISDSSSNTMLLCQPHITSLSSYDNEHINQQEEEVYSAELLQGEIEEKTGLNIKHMNENIPPAVSCT